MVRDFKNTNANTQEQGYQQREYQQAGIFKTFWRDRKQMEER